MRRSSVTTWDSGLSLCSSSSAEEEEEENPLNKKNKKSKKNANANVNNNGNNNDNDNDIINVNFNVNVNDNDNNNDNDTNETERCEYLRDQTLPTRGNVERSVHDFVQFFSIRGLGRTTKCDSLSTKRRYLQSVTCKRGLSLVHFQMQVVLF